MFDFLPCSFPPALYFKTGREKVILSGRRKNFTKVVLLPGVFGKENKPKALGRSSGISN